MDEGEAGRKERVTDDKEQKGRVINENKREERERKMSQVEGRNRSRGRGGESER